MRWLAVWLIGALVQSPTVVEMSVHIRDAKAGTAQIEQRLLPDGGKHVRVTMRLRQAGQAVTVRQESVYDATGEPVRMIEEVQNAEGRTAQRRLATFDANGANLRTTLDGKTDEREVPLAANLPRAATSEFWFLRARPKPGDRVSYYAFSPSQARWSLTTARYVGRTRVMGIEGHEIRVGGATLIVDGQGAPLLLESGAMSLKRVAPRSDGSPDGT